MEADHAKKLDTPENILMHTNKDFFPNTKNKYPAASSVAQRGLSQARSQHVRGLHMFLL